MPANLGMFSVGDKVVGNATKGKDSWNNRAGTVVVVLAKHYKVEMTEGPAKGTTHKYAHKHVTSAVPLAEAATGAAAEAAMAATGDNQAAATGAAAEAATAATGANQAAATGDATDSAEGWTDFMF